MTESDVAIIIGRWQILQRGHGTLLKAALASAPRVIVVIGSAWHSRDARNPFTWQERQEQFETVLSPADRARVSFLPVRDYYNDDRWAEAVRGGVARLAARDRRITLVGFKKDQTSEYLDIFPGWTLLEVEPEYDINSTDLRAIYFEMEHDLPAALSMIGSYVEPGVRAYLEAWSKLPAYRRCAAEHRAVIEYRKKWPDLGFTADAVVTARDHVLLVRRGGDIGHGLWALPGGFVERHERSYTAAVRELAEETGYKPLPITLKNAFRGQAMFDHPLRSPRARIVTSAFHFDLGDVQLPEVHGQDDAKEARWTPVADLPALEDQLFEDHPVILDHFLGWLPTSA